MELGIVFVVMLALLGGSVAGASVALVLSRRRRIISASTPDSNEAIPSGVRELLQSIEFPAIVVQPPFFAVGASAAASQLGLVGGGRVANRDLIALVTEAETSSNPVERELEVPRGPFGDATSTLVARATAFGRGFVLLLVADRTEFRRLEEVRRDFVANISHELKTPIGAISLLAEALTQAADDPTQVRHFARRLSDESARLASITREIIDLSRLQAEGALAKFSSVSVDEVVRVSAEANKVLAVAKSIDVAVGGDTGARVHGDQDRLVVALNNLLSNAIQYSPEGSRVGVGVSAHDDRVEIVVTDQGPGMSQEETERVFERFYRTDEARSRRTGGTGLGLSIVKHIVHHHGGDIRIWSKPGEGSSFTVRLPRDISTKRSGR